MIKRQKRILIVTSLKDKKKSYLKKPLITTSDMFYHNLKKNYLNINCLVVRSHWQKKKINKKILYINKIYRYYLKRISKKLNTIHKVNYSDKYWSILIGIWLMRFICLSYDISENIKLVKKKHSILYVKIAKYSEKDYLLNDFQDFDNKLLEDYYRNAIYHQIIKILNYFPVRKFNFIKNKLSTQSHNIKKISLKIKSISFILSLFNFFSFLKKKTDFLFLSNYFSIKFMFYLKLRLNEFPFFYNKNIMLKFKKIKKLRIWNKNWNKNNSDNFTNIMDILIPNNIPKIYLEGYKKTVKIINTLNWPQQPKFIFSDSNFMSDSVFQFYLAEKKTKYNTKFVSAQHGGNYFTSKYNFSLNWTKNISDFFLTWGYQKKNNNKFIPMFNFYKYDVINFKKNFRILIVDYEVPNYLIGLSGGILIELNQFKFVQDKINFIKKLNLELQKLTVIKLFPINLGWNIDQLYKKELSYTYLTPREDNFQEWLKKSRICVINFESTVYLNTLNANFPTILFFNNDIFNFPKEFLLDLKVLKQAGILFNTPEEAANKVNLIWDSIDYWWNSKKVQDAITFFCNKYSRRSNSKYKDMYSFFKKFY